jgi:tRNA(adenine34) deaminase
MFTTGQIHKFLNFTLVEAQKAYKAGNYPIGSMIVSSDGEILSVDRNQCHTNNDISAHAEMLGIRNLGQKLSKDNPGENYLFTSLEPCFGCSFFIARTNIKHVVYALKDPHKGGISDLTKIGNFKPFFENIELISAPNDELKEISRKLMRQYFLHIGQKSTAALYGYKA